MATTTLIDDADPSISYVGVWQHSGHPGEFMGTTTFTMRKGDTARLTFASTNVSVWGTIGDNAGVPISSYSIDGGNATIFDAGKLTAQVQQRQQFFQSKELTAANHTLVITSLADNAYFVLDYIAITPIVSPTVPALVPSSTLNLSSTSILSGTSSPVPSSEAKLPLGPIIGSALGGFALLVVAFAAFMFFRRRRNSRSSAHYGEPALAGNSSLWTSSPRANADAVSTHTTVNPRSEKRSLMNVSSFSSNLSPSSNVSHYNTLRQDSLIHSVSGSLPSNAALPSPSLDQFSDSTTPPDLPPPRYEV